MGPPIFDPEYFRFFFFFIHRFFFIIIIFYRLRDRSSTSWATRSHKYYQRTLTRQEPRLRVEVTVRYRLENFGQKRLRHVLPVTGHGQNATGHSSTQSWPVAWVYLPPVQTTLLNYWNSTPTFFVVWHTRLTHFLSNKFHNFLANRLILIYSKESFLPSKYLLCYLLCT